MLPLAEAKGLLDSLDCQYLPQTKSTLLGLMNKKQVFGGNRVNDTHMQAKGILLIS